MGRPHYDEIDKLYRRILQRPVDPSGYATYSRLMASGELAEDGLAKILRDSEEFMLLVHQPAESTRFEISSKLHIADRQRAKARTLLRKSPRGTVAATIASKRYIANARVTAESFRRHHPDIPFILLLTDVIDGYLDPCEEPFEILTLDALCLPDLHQFIFQYTELETSYAATPFLLDGLLAAGFERVVFLKQETLVLGSLADLIGDLGSHSFFVTPHLLVPPDPAVAAEAELEVLRAGVFNGGILGASDTPETRSFLAWWMERTYCNCYRLVDSGLHFEQRWLNFLPTLVSDTLIVRDPGVNLGHWNLVARDVRAQKGNFTARGAPLRVFRFSGFDPERPQHVSRYSDLEVRETGAASEIFRTYHSMLVEAGYHQVKAWPYAYGSFDNGVRIPDIARRIYRDLNDDTASFSDPRRNAETDGSFYHWLRQPASGSRVSNLWQTIYDREPAGRLNFRRVEDLAGEGFIAWWRRFGAPYEIPETLYPNAGRCG